MDEENSNSDKKMSRKPSGILRVDTSNKPRRLSGSSVEFNLQPELLGCEVSRSIIKANSAKHLITELQQNF